MTVPRWAISVASYNLLADAYIKPEHYPRVAPEDFLPENRHPRLDARVAGLGTDVICLQEVEHAAFARLETRLRPLGYRGRWAHRPRGKMDGCATFVRAPWRVHTSPTREFEDRPPKPTNRIALVTVLSCGIGRVVVANTHLEWHAPDAADDMRHGLFQAEELIESLLGQDAIVCGDFNAEPDSATLKRFRKAGYIDPHHPSLATFNAAGRPAKLDYLLHSASLAATPAAATYVGSATPLPSKVEPSDHIPLIATFAPRR